MIQKEHTFKFMKKTLFLFLLFTNICFAQSPLNKILDFTVEDSPISEALLQLSEQASTDIAFSNNFFKKQKNITAQYQQTSLETILKDLLQRSNIAYKVVADRILLFKKKEQFYTISGYIEDENSGERLIAATVFSPSMQQGTTTNEYGFYSLRLPKGTTDVLYSYLGYAQHLEHVTLEKNRRQDIQLNNSITLAEVIVRPDSILNNSSPSEARSDFYPIHKKMLTISPDLGGEADPIRGAQLLPGIQAGADGLGGSLVRGGDSGQNLMLLDGVPVYIPYHLLGLFSIYNPHTVRSAKIYKGSFPARYGGRLSSVFDIRTREGNQYHWDGLASVNLLSGNALIEGPIQKGKGALLLAGRASHSGFLFNSFFQDTYFSTTPEAVETAFFDVNAKLNYTLSPKDRLYLSHYRGSDEMSSSSEAEEEDALEEQAVELNWANAVTAIRWNHLFNDKLFSNTTLTHSKFGYEYTVLEQFIEDGEDLPSDLFLLDMYSDNNDIGLKTEFDYLPSNKQRFRFGGGIAAREFVPEVTYIEEEEIDFEELENIEINEFEQFRDREVFTAVEAHLYVENQLHLSPKWKVDAGLRASSFLTDDKNYVRLEPRLKSTYRLHEKLWLHTAMSRMVQYLHLVSYGNVRLPNDLWIPSSEELLPEEAWQGEIGLSWEANTQTQLSLDAYYKKLDNLYVYPENYDFEEEDFYQILVSGQGIAQGVEFSIRHDTPTRGGQFSYAYANSTRQFDAINEGETYPYAHNQPHQLKLFVYQKLGRNWHLGLNWVFNSAGPPLNITPLGSIQEEVEDEDVEMLNPLEFTPDNYHRLDLSANYQFISKGLEHHFKFGAYNFYDRQNITYFRIDFQADDEALYSPVYGLGFRPSFSYRFSF